MKFAVMEKYFDSGKIVFGKVTEVPDSTMSSSGSKENYDWYQEIYDTREDAEKSRQSVKETEGSACTLE